MRPPTARGFPRTKHDSCTCPIAAPNRIAHATVTTPLLRRDPVRNAPRKCGGSEPRLPADVVDSSVISTQDRRRRRRRWERRGPLVLVLSHAGGSHAAETTTPNVRRDRPRNRTLATAACPARDGRTYAS